MSEELGVDEVREALRTYFRDRPGVAEVRRTRDAVDMADEQTVGFDRPGWRTMAVELGFTSMAVPENWDGLGLGVPHLVAAVEECGASLYPGPARAASLIGWVLRSVDRTQVPASLTEAIEGFLSGDVVPGLATAEGVGGAVQLEDAPEMAGGTVTGRIETVTHGAIAELVLCTVRTPEGATAALVRCADPTSPETTRARVDSVDLSTPLGNIVVERAPAVALTAPGDEQALDRMRTASRLLLAAEQVGGAEGCLAGMIEHAKVRRQFDQLIGSYQAIQHRCSQTAINIAAARALVSSAASAVERGDSAAAEQMGLLARAESADCFNGAADGLIQISGGIGFTWEHDAHLYFRRARATAALGGTADQHRADAVRAGCVDLLVASAS